MDQQGETSKKPGTRTATTGVVVLVLGLVLLVINLTSTVTNYVAGVGLVETKGAVSPGAIVLLLVGLLLAGVGFARRVLGALERR